MTFRNWITPDGAHGPTGRGGFKAEPGRYHLYVAYICPRAFRVLMARRLKGLEELIGFPGADEAPHHGARYLHRLLALEGIAETVNLEHIKAGYYSIKALNPTGIVPVGLAAL